MCVSNSWEGSNSATTVRYANHPTILSRTSENGPLHMLEKFVEHCKKFTPIEVCNFKKAAMPHPGMPKIRKSVNRHYVLNTPCTRQRWQVFDLYDRKILCFICVADIWHAQGKIEFMPCTGDIWHTHKVCYFHSTDHNTCIKDCMFLT